MSHPKPLYLFELLMAVPNKAPTCNKRTQALLTRLHYTLVLVPPSQALPRPVLGCATPVLPIDVPILIRLLGSILRELCQAMPVPQALGR